MLTYNLDNKGNIPLYEYLYKCIKEDILSGNIKAGERLTSKRDMAKNHNISIITVENAYAQLIVEGYIFAVEKKGYYVSKVKENYIEVINDLEIENEKYLNHKKYEDWIVNFNSNHVIYDSFPFNTWSKVMRQTLADQEKSFLSSPEPNGVWELREAIATHLQQFRGMTVNPNNIIVGAGTEYLYSLIVQLLGRNIWIAIEDPGYKKIGEIYENQGIKCLRIKIDDEGIDVNRLQGSNAKAVHISPSHHFPTGKVMPITRRHQLLNWAEKNNSYIIEDDYDSEFRFSGKPIPTMASVNSERVIYMNTFSKTLAPSIRIAYMVLPDKLMKKYKEKLGFYSSTVSSFEQYTLANFISKGYYERHINRMRNYYREYREKIISAIKNSNIYNKVTIEEENAGLHFILGINKEINDSEFIEYLKSKKINISSVKDYCYNNFDEYNHKFIINYSAVEEKQLQRALSIINEGLNMNKYKVNKEFNIKVPKSVNLIIKLLEENGHEAFAVGGCVRDTILGRNPQDWDITTSALPEQVKEIFHRTIDTGIQHGTVTVMMNHVGYEVTTYRIDGEYKDSRRPESVEFTSNLIEDLKRRDFTINAMAYNPSIGLVDAFDGIGDIKRKLIKCVGNPKERFGEDALRILRAVRFSAQLGFEVEEETIKACKELSLTLKNISAERIYVELEKLILSNNPSKLINAYEMGITKVVLPEFDKMMECEQITPYHCYNVGIHTIKVMENVEPTKVLRWAALFHDVAKPVSKIVDEKTSRTHFKGHAHMGVELASKIMRRLKMDNKTIKIVSRLIECHDDRPADKIKTPEIIRRSVNKIGKDIYPEYLQIAYADFQGKSDYGKEKGFDGYLYAKEQYEYIIKNNICTCKEEMAIRGQDLIDLGCPLGSAIGDLLKEMLDIVLTNPEFNTKEYLIKEAKKQISEKYNI